jgi:hypothetical protein
MIVYPSRALTRVVALLLLPVLGLVALAFAVAAVIGGDAARSVADSAQLTAAWRSVGTFLAETAPDGGSTALLAAAGAVLAGLVLLIGALAPAKDREIELRGEPHLTVRRRALRGAAASLAGTARGTTATKVRLRTRRLRSGGRLRVTATRSPRAEARPIKQTLSERIDPLANAFSLRSSVSSRVGKSRKSRTA